MKRGVTVLGTMHQIQGADNVGWKNIEDPAFLGLVNRFLEKKDFIFEEALGLGPTTVQRLAVERFGIDHYLDIDPHRDNRSAYGIGATGRQHPVDPWRLLIRPLTTSCQRLLTKLDIPD